MSNIKYTCQGYILQIISYLQSLLYGSENLQSSTVYQYIKFM